MARRLVLVAVCLLVAGAAALWWAGLHGFSTRAEPSRFERFVARAARRWSVPSGARNVTNPITFSAEAWSESRAHFADHCAICHANDGSGNTEIGRNLYPKAPDMRLDDTQQLRDGELYWIIENGVRLTGMPAWGDGSDHDKDTWKLVHFIRHLKELTPEQLHEMEALNPKSPSELHEEQQDRDFLEGKDPESTSTPSAHHHKEQP